MYLLNTRLTTEKFLRLEPPCCLPQSHSLTIDIADITSKVSVVVMDMEVNLSSVSADCLFDEFLPSPGFFRTDDSPSDVIILSDHELSASEKSLNENILDKVVCLSPNEAPNFVDICSSNDSNDSQNGCDHENKFTNLRARSTDDDDDLPVFPRQSPSPENTVLKVINKDTQSRRKKLSPEEQHKRLADLELSKQRKLQKDEERRKTKEAAEESKRQRAETRNNAKTEKFLATEREKLLKKIEKDNHRNSKPDESIKFMTAIIDSRLMDLPVGKLLPSLLESAEINFETQDLSVPYCITWRREIVESQLSQELEIEKNKTEIEENEVLIYIPVEKFLGLVQAFKQDQMGMNSQDETIITHAAGIKRLLKRKSLTFIVVGCDKYFSTQKTAAQRRYRANVLNENNETAKRKRSKKTTDHEISITEIDVEEAIVALQIAEECNVCMVKSAAGVASEIVCFTKAIASAPYKRAKYESKVYLNANVESHKTARVKNSGEGLLLLWQQQLEQFNLVTCDISHAITANYPSPHSLLQAYKHCISTKEKERLLQDITIRRGTGPLATTRRIGPELSRKIFLHFTSTNPNLNLNAS